jgi:hypothetical protein
MEINDLPPEIQEKIVENLTVPTLRNMALCSRHFCDLIWNNKRLRFALWCMSCGPPPNIAITPPFYHPELYVGEGSWMLKWLYFMFELKEEDFDKTAKNYDQIMTLIRGSDLPDVWFWQVPTLYSP